VKLVRSIMYIIKVLLRKNNKFDQILQSFMYVQMGVHFVKYIGAHNKHSLFFEYI
jgi:hypothetical protein